MNRNDYQSGWDTDQFPNNVPEMALAYYHILQGGGFETVEPDDLLMAHIGGMDCCARGLKAAAAMIEEGTMPKFVTDRYAGWNDTKASKMLAGDLSLGDIEDYVRGSDVNPDPVSGRQEYLENVVNRFV